MLLAAMIPLITDQLGRATPRATEATLNPPSTPLFHRREASPPLLPIPATGTEIQACLGDFLKAKGIDLSRAGDILADLDLTPDIISEVPVTRLCSVMDAVEGRVLKFQMFAREWNNRLQVKKRRLH